MKRLSSTSITLTLLLTLAAACTESERNGDYQRICVDANLYRTNETFCNNDDTPTFGHTVIWMNPGHAAPPLGSRVPAGTYTTTKPTTGVITNPPHKGGFGTYRAGTSTSGGG